MLLSIDIGNSSVFIGVTKDGSIAADFRFTTNKQYTAHELKARFLKMFELFENKGLHKNDIKDVIVASVVPELDKTFKGVISKILNLTPFFVDINANLGIVVKVKRPEQVGIDRLVNACAAHFIAHDDLIVIDFGTATTFDYVTKSGEFRGGVITPGLSISAEALYLKTSKLPVIEFKRPDKVIGDDTVSAMQSGLYNGYIGLVENIVARMKDEIKTPVKVIATGGTLPFFNDSLKMIEIRDERLTLKGLNIIYNLNHAVIL